ncbi:hypothetical protein IWX50DRAFT_448443 [Phyllosticta citricarpa]
MLIRLFAFGFSAAARLQMAQRPCCLFRRLALARLPVDIILPWHHAPASPSRRDVRSTDPPLLHHALDGAAGPCNSSLRTIQWFTKSSRRRRRRRRRIAARHHDDAFLQHCSC